MVRTGQVPPGADSCSAPGFFRLIALASRTRRGLAGWNRRRQGCPMVFYFIW